MGHGPILRVPQFVEDNLLDVTVPDMVNYAFDAILIESRRFYDKRKIEISAY